MSACATCLPIDCVPDDDFEYSIDRRTQLYGYVWDCPPGAYCFTSGVPVTMNCCGHRVTGQVPPGATLAQAKAALAELVRQCMTYRKGCGSGTIDDTNGDGDPIQPDGGVNICFSNAVCATASCGDGTEFRWCLRAGAFMDTTCAAANANAVAEARRLASLYKVCLSDISRTCCIGNPYIGTIVASGLPLAVFPIPNYWEISAGELPPGLSFETGWQTGYTRSFSGTPTTVGSYPFKVKVTAPNGAFMEKSYRLDVLEISTASPLPDATPGVYYSQTLDQNGGSVPILWEIESGALPDGLDLDPVSGTIMGTPEGFISGNYTFTVKITDANDATCSKQFIIAAAMITPIYYWTFEDHTAIIDAINLIELTPSDLAKVATTTGKVNNCVEMLPNVLGGVQVLNLASVTGDIPYAGDESFTVSMWAKWDSATPNNTVLFGYESGNMAYYFSRIGNHYQVEIWDGVSTEVATLIKPIVAGQWYFFVFWFDADTGRGGFEVDRADETWTVNPLSLPADATMDFYIRRVKNVSDPAANEIEVDELAWFDSLLSTGQKDFLHNSGNGRTYPW